MAPFRSRGALMGVRRRLGCAVVICVASMACAEAADFEVGVPPPTLVRAPVVRFFSWSGCYLGGHFGGAFVNNDITGTFLVPTGPVGDLALVNVADTLPISFGSNGFLVGGQGGCNLEFTNRLVIGFEADASWVNASGSSRQTLGGSFASPLFGLPVAASTDGTLSTQTDFTATATARLGYAFGSIGQGLIYGKGGAAWIGNRYSLTGQLVCQQTCGTLITPFDWTTRETRIGWTIGAGVEWAMWGNWTIKGEYNYLDFGTRALTLNDPVLGPINASVRQTVNEVKFGINYRFATPLQSTY
jgi:outer membrane immunogenic protein